MDQVDQTTGYGGGGAGGYRSSFPGGEKLCYFRCQDQMQLRLVLVDIWTTKWNGSDGNDTIVGYIHSVGGAGGHATNGSQEPGREEDQEVVEVD